jgi:hypothetical protein
MAEVEISGWLRTALLGVGAFLGVLAVSGALHLAKEWGLIR